MQIPTYKVKKEILISRKDLANTIGIAKETLIRTLHDFKDEEIIDLKEKSITIRDPRKLNKIQ
jgi:CRP-like cAMP-binding protein